MGTRGRKSAASLEVATVGQVEAVVRPDAPYDLADEAADVWKATLEALPADWIGPEAHPVLAAYCRTTISVRRLGQLLHQAETEPGPLDISNYIALQRAHGQQAQVLKTLATSLRLTPQTRLRAESAAQRAGKHRQGPAPWEHGKDRSE